MGKQIVCSIVSAVSFVAIMQFPNSAMAVDKTGTTQPTQVRRIALIVQNHSESTSVPMEALADVLTAKLSGRGFHVINPGNVIGVTQNRTAAGELMPKVSAIDLARQVGAEGAITATVTEYLDSTVGMPPVFHQYSVRMSFSLADTKTGATICGESVKKDSPKYTNNQVAQNQRAYWRDLLNAAAEECAERLERAANDQQWHPASGIMQDINSEKIDELIKTVAQLNKDVQKIKAEMQQFLKETKNEKTSVLTVSDLDNTVQKLMSRMREDENYRQNYEKATKKMNRVPIVVVGIIKDETGGADGHPGITNLLAAVRVGIRVSLFKSGLFEVKDDDAGVSLANRIIENGKSPLEDKELMSALEGHGSPDFYFLGDLRYFGEEKKYRLRLALHSLMTGKIIWEDTIDK